MALIREELVDRLICGTHLSRACFIAILIAAFCNTRSAMAEPCTAATDQQISISGPTEMRAGTSATFLAIGKTSSANNVIWGVSGAREDASGGTISTSGEYRAPLVQQTVVISLSIAGNPSSIACHSLKILPPLPSIESTSVSDTGNGKYVLDVYGNGFSTATRVIVNGQQAPTSWLSSTQLRTTVPQESFNDPMLAVSIIDSVGSERVRPPSRPIDTPFPRWLLNVPFGSSPQDLVGCENPNIGESTGDWGNASSTGVYFNTDAAVQLIGNPTYTSNAIFWVSRETMPGQSVLMTGAFTSAQKDVRLALIPPGTVDWQSVVQKSSTIIPVTQNRSSALFFEVPSSFPSGVYGFELEDQTANPVFALANAPSISWLVGVPATSDPSEALLHSIHDCGAEPGEVLRVFGKNFTPTNNLIIKSTQGGSSQVLSPIASDSNSMSAQIPIEVSPGSYYAWVGNTQWDAASSEPILLTILSSLAPSVVSFNCDTLVGDGITDNTKLLQSCLDSYAPQQGANEVVEIKVPNGQFLLTGGVTLHPFESLAGVSSASTEFVGQAANAPNAWFTIPKHVGLTGFSLFAPANPNLLASSDLSGNPTSSGSLFVSNVDFESTADLTNGNELMFKVAGPDIQIYNSRLVSRSGVNFGLLLGDGAVISGNTLVDTNSFTGIQNSQNVIFEKNESYSEDGPGPAGGAGLSISRAFSEFGPSFVSRDIYVGYSSFHDMGMEGQQVVNTDGGAGAYLGYIASSSTDSVTLANDPSWVWTGTTNPSATSIKIIDGTGVGQYSVISSYSGRTINLATPWKIPPDSTSVVSITAHELNLTVAHDSFTNVMGEAFNLVSEGLETAVEDNALTNVGDGIQIGAYGPYGGPADYGSTFNTDVLRNTNSAGSGNLVTNSTNTNIAGIGMSDMPACAISGLLIRNNSIPYNQTIYDSEGWYGMNGVLIEQNQANLLDLNAPWFLTQDNQSVSTPVQ